MMKNVECVYDEEKKEEEDDLFWRIVSEYDEFSHNKDENEDEDEKALKESTIYQPKVFSISSKKDDMHRSTVNDNEAIDVFVGEMKNDGCMSEVGGEVWDASILLCCYILLNQKTFLTASVLELGAGLGVPGLLLATLKLRCSDMHKRISKVPLRIGSVCLTDYDGQILDNIVRCLFEQFHSSYEIKYQSLFNTCVDSETLDDICMTVKQLDWTSELYNIDCMSTPSEDHVEIRQRSNETHDVLIGSELI